jgi:molybdenum cofactor cytidylyltransferase
MSSCGHDEKREAAAASGVECNQMSQHDREQAIAMILAAGAATRMGSLKQLLPYGEGTLLSHAIAQAQGADFDRVIVILGAQAGLIAPILERTRAEIVVNPRWEAGMGSSIRSGLKYLEDRGQTPSVLGVLVADQPYVTAVHLIAMRKLLAESGSPAVAAEYDGHYGVPALFRRNVFPLLASLSPEAGARQLLRSKQISVAGFPLPEAAVDIDTPADFAKVEAVRP